MTGSRKQRGFLLPLVTLLMVLFSGVWLIARDNPTNTEQSLLGAVELQQELLFWHRGVLRFYQKMGYWPFNLSAVEQFFQLHSPYPGLAGLATADGFDLTIIGIKKDLLRPIILPLKEAIQLRPDGGYFIAIRSPSDSAHDPRLITRVGDAAVDVSSNIDFTGYALQVAAVSTVEASFATVKNRDLLAQAMTSLSLKSQNLHANDIRIGHYSLITQQQLIEQLYQQLWYCVRVSEGCLRSQQSM